MKKIEMGKKYRTRGIEELGIESVEVRVLCIDAPGRWPVVSIAPNGMIFAQSEDGKYPGAPALDLIEIRERVRQEWWVNVYPNGSVRFLPTRKLADETASEYRIACVPVVIDCEVGEGLEDAP